MSKKSNLGNMNEISDAMREVANKKSDRSLEGWTEAIKTSSNQTREEDAKFFLDNEPIKEFSIERDGELVNYRIYEWDDEDFAVFYQMPNGKYSMRHKLMYTKKIVKELMELL